jgi:hypothetical protein
LAGVAVFALVSGAEGVAWMQHGRQHGLGFTGRSWQQSSLRAEIVAVSSERVLFSNSPEAVYFLTGLPAHVLPKKIEVTKQRPNDNYQAELLAMGEAHGLELVVVFFTDINQRNVPSISDLQQLLGLTAVVETSDGIILATDCNC